MHSDSCVQAEVAVPRQYSFKEGRGQVVCCLLAAHAMCQLPLDLDLTDGKQHHLLRLRGDLLLVYEGCTPTQVRQTCASFWTSPCEVSISSITWVSFQCMYIWHSSNILISMENSAGSSVIPYLLQYALSITHVMLQAYHEMADFLIRQGTMLTSKLTIPEPPAELEENLRRPIKKLKGLVQGAALTDQVQSILSFCSSTEDQVCMAYEIARHWAPPIPACVSFPQER